MLYLEVVFSWSPPLCDSGQSFMAMTLQGGLVGCGVNYSLAGVWSAFLCSHRVQASGKGQHRRGAVSLSECHVTGL